MGGGGGWVEGNRMKGVRRGERGGQHWVMERTTRKLPTNKVALVLEVWAGGSEYGACCVVCKK